MLAKFLKLIENLNYYKVEYILIGGFAIILYGYNRITNDIDLIINGTIDNLNNLRNALNNLYSDKSIEEITIDELENYSVIRYGTPDDFNIDIIKKIGEKSYNDTNFEIVCYNNIRVNVATPESLYKMKEKTMRPIDEMDILFLRELLNKRKNAPV
jgi:hypothetical protein